MKSGLSDGVLKRSIKVDMQTYGPKIELMGKARGAAVAEKEKKDKEERDAMMSPKEKEQKKAADKLEKDSADKRKPPTLRRKGEVPPPGEKQVP